MRYFLLIFLCLAFANISLCLTPQEPIIITKQTLDLSGEQRLFYALEAGDVLVIDLEVTKGKYLKEFEIIAYPNTSKLLLQKVEKLQGNKIRIFHRGIYEFRFQSGNAKVINFSLQRIPFTPKKRNFDTTVKWKTVQDSIRKNYREKVTTTHDTSWITKERKVLVRIDTQFVTVADRQERVHSYTNLTGSNRSNLQFDLPPNTQTNLTSRKVVAWAYWIGVGQQGMENYNQELRKFLLQASVKVGSKNMLAGIALGAYALAVNPPEGDNIKYELLVNQTAVGNGNVTVCYGRELHQLQGNINLKLDNDNIINGINIGIKIVAVMQHKHYRTETYQEKIITPITEVSTKGRIIIKERQVPYIN